MGVVYLAREVPSGREIALKVLPADLCASEEAFGRFQREAVLAASISDARCVFVYGAHQFEGSPAIAMELVRGETLEQVIKKGQRIPVRQAVQWTIELLEGLDAAHHAGVLHRDMKPSNCFVAEDGHVKIGDFGLSRSLDTDVQLTQSGVFLGSPLYAAPEQIKGRKVDERSDMYSAAATLYALLTGKAPYSGTNLGEVLSRILSEPPERPRVHRPEIPRGLEKVLLRAMQRDPDDRYEDIGSFREALHPFAVEAQAGTLPRRFAAYLADVVIVMLMSVVSTSLLGVLSSIKFQSNPDTNQLQMGLLPYWSVLESYLYFVIFEGLWTATPGKWLLGLRTVDSRTLERSLPRVALRAFIYTLPLVASSMVISTGALQTSATVSINLSSFAGFIPWVVRSLYFVTARRSNGLRAVHEFLSGTRVLQRALPFPLPRRAKIRVEHALLPAQGLPEAVGSYRVRGLVAETAFGRLLEAEDSALSRRVWLCAGEKQPLPLDAARRQSARRGRLHWLGSVEHGGLRHDVFEAPGGATLVEWLSARKRIEWPAAQQILTTLAEELESSERDSPKERFALEQVWIDRWSNVRLLDVPLDASAKSTLNARELLGRTAALFLPTGGQLPRSLPGAAEPIFERILGRGEPYASAADARKALATIETGGAEVGRKQRVVQISIATALLCFLSLIMFVTLILKGAVDDLRQQSRVYLQDLAAGRSTITNEVLDAEDIRARQIALRQITLMPGCADFEASLDESQRAQFAQAKQAVSTIDTQEMKSAQQHLESKHQRPPGNMERVFGDPRSKERYLFGIFGGVWVALAVLVGIALRGGATMRMFGILLRDGRGRRAGRLRCGLRSLCAWSPLLVLLVPAQAYGSAWGAVLVAFALLGLGAAYAIWRPTRGLPDLLAGTWLAPR